MFYIASPRKAFCIINGPETTYKRDDHTVETDETNNVIEYSLAVGQEQEQSLTGGWLDRLREEDTLTLGIASFAVLVVLGVLIALRRSSRSDDMEWDDDDEF